MKKLILFFLFFIFTAEHVHAQTIDSIIVKVTKENNYNGQWEFVDLEADSFSNGLLIDELYQYRGNNTWINSSLNQFTYSSSILSSKTVFQWNSTQWDSVQSWIYIHSVIPDSTIHQLWNGGWNNSTLTITYPNSTGSDSISIVQQWINSSWRDQSKVDYVYSPDSTLLTATNSIWDTTSLQWNIIGRIIYEFIGGHEVSEIEQTYSNGTWYNYLRHSGLYFYNGGINFTSTSGWDNTDSAFTITHSTGFTNHDSLGHLTYVYRDNTPGGFGEITLTYDSLGNPLTDHSYYESMGGIVSDYFSQWYYSTYPSPIIHVIMSNDTISICSNDTVPSDVFAFGGTSSLHFQWTPSAGLTVDSIESPFVISDSTTNYILTVSDDSLNVAMDSLRVIVYPVPFVTNIQSINTSCIGCGDGGFLINVIGYGPPFNLWCDALGGYTTTDSTISGIHAGIYLILINDTNACTISLTDTVFDPSSNLKELNNFNVEIYPNPFEKYLIVRTDKIEPSMQFELIDITGKNILTENIYFHEQRIDRKNLAAGNYSGIVRSNDHIIKIVKIIVSN